MPNSIPLSAYSFTWPSFGVSSAAVHAQISFIQTKSNQQKNVKKNLFKCKSNKYSIENELNDHRKRAHPTFIQNSFRYFVQMVKWLVCVCAHETNLFILHASLSLSIHNVLLHMVDWNYIYRLNIINMRSSNFE